MIMSGGYTLHFRYFIKTYMVIKTTEERERERRNTGGTTCKIFLAMDQLLNFMFH